MDQALNAAGNMTDLMDALDTFREKGIIQSSEFILELRVSRDSAVAIENYFLLQTFDQQATPIKKRKKTND
jgi:hypothetical protein